MIIRNNGLQAIVTIHHAAVLVYSSTYTVYAYVTVALTDEMASQCNDALSVSPHCSAMNDQCRLLRRHHN